VSALTRTARARRRTSAIACVMSRSTTHAGMRRAAAFNRAVRVQRAYDAGMLRALVGLTVLLRVGRFVFGRGERVDFAPQGDERHRELTVNARARLGLAHFANANRLRSTPPLRRDFDAIGCGTRPQHLVAERFAMPRFVWRRGSRVVCAGDGVCNRRATILVRMRRSITPSVRMRTR